MTNMERLKRTGKNEDDASNVSMGRCALESWNARREHLGCKSLSIARLEKGSTMDEG